MEITIDVEKEDVYAFKKAISTIFTHWDYANDKNVLEEIKRVDNIYHTIKNKLN